ncbi:hypothetical protein ZWY2020_053332, partial [Hordeum vulgare]
VVPCNVRLDFNELINEDTVIFDYHGGTYTMEVNKVRNITQIGGDEWVVSSPICISLTRSGKNLPPRDAYVGMPFVTHLTWTMVNRHVM